MLQVIAICFFISLLTPWLTSHRVYFSMLWVRLSIFMTQILAFLFPKMLQHFPPSLRVLSAWIERLMSLSLLCACVCMCQHISTSILMCLLGQAQYLSTGTDFIFTSVHPYRNHRLGHFIFKIRKSLSSEWSARFPRLCCPSSRDGP